MGTGRVSAGRLGLNRSSRLAPRFTTTCPGPGQSFRDQDIAEAMSIPHEDPQRPTVAILVTTRPCLHFEWTLVDQLYQSLGRAVAARKFRGTFGLADLRCVDVGDPNFCAVDPQRIAIDDAGDPMAQAAFFKFYGSHIRCGQCQRRSISRQGDGACDAWDYRDVASPSLFSEEKPEMMWICQTSNAPLS